MISTHKPITVRSNRQIARVRRIRLAELLEAEKERDQLRHLVSLQATDNFQLRNAYGELRRERDQAVTNLFRLIMAGADATVLDG